MKEYIEEFTISMIGDFIKSKAEMVSWETKLYWALWLELNPINHKQ